MHHEKMAETEFVVDKEKLEVRMSRVFDVPREKVWRAHVDPKKLEQWWGPRKYTTIVEKWDARVGGKWKFINKDADETHVFYGEFREIKEPEKIVWTFTYEPYPDQELVETLTLEELPGGPPSHKAPEGQSKTRLSTVSRYPNLEALEGMLMGGEMEKGARETWDRLEELLVKEKVTV